MCGSPWVESILEIESISRAGVSLKIAEVITKEITKKTTKKTIRETLCPHNTQ
ncbi:hypothetical protein GCM10025791_48710 [Halioxenophilus aromaticivorans]|uniref:Uncharacterized protein n=1 Tax=Halioxenophilus aromaticivorans TaxID=1306992 RepID=A0AAV3UAJ4_9ALTE